MPQPPAVREIIERYPVLGLIGNTPLVRVDLFKPELPNFSVHAKLEYFNPGGSIKDRPVLRMLAEAVASGEVRGRTVLDSSSGNAGIAYAMIGSVLGLKVELIVPGNASVERKKRILAHGATLTHTDPLDGYDEALRVAHRMAEEQADEYFFCDQYKNDGNWRAHFDTTAEEILAQTDGRLTHFVAGVGTGGTVTGVGRRLKQHDPEIQVWSVRPEVFPGVEGLKPLGHPGDIVPDILDESVVDRWIDVTSEEAQGHAQRMARAGLFVGQSSGAYLEGALQVGREVDDAVVVTMFSDFGERYISTPLWELE